MDQQACNVSPGAHGFVPGSVPIHELHTHHDPLEAAADVVRSLPRSGDRPVISVTVEP